MRWLVPFLLPIVLTLSADRSFSMRRPVLGPGSPVIAIPIPLDTKDASRKAVGRLRYIAGWQLKNEDSAFGSFSAMILDPDPVLLNDAGGFVRVTMRGGAWPATFGNLPDGPGGDGLKRNRDTEAMTRGEAGGPVWIGFEGRNAIWRYSADLSRAGGGRAPPEMRKWPGNGGPEAIVRLRSGRFIVFCEKCDGPPGSRDALLFDRDPVEAAAKVVRFYYRPPSGYQVTDAASLPDGKVLLLHRRLGVWPLFAAKLSILDPKTIRKDEIAMGEEIATFEPPLQVDNMEALAVARDGGRTIVWIASDDNFGTPFQRSLLLKFELLPR